MQTVIVAMQHGIPVARIELLDDVQMDACIRYSKLEGFAAKPTLFFEFHGSDAGVAEQAAQMQAITEELGGSAFEWATQARGPDAAVEGAARRVLRGEGDVSRQAGLRHRRLRADLAARRLHARDARPTSTRPASSRRSSATSATAISISACCSIPTIPGERAQAEGLAKRISLRAIAMGGTCTGEHGIGVHKLDALVAEHGEAVESDAHDQARARSAQHHESRQDGAALGIGAHTKHRTRLPSSRSRRGSQPAARTDLTCTPSISATRTTRRGRCAAGSR